MGNRKQNSKFAKEFGRRLKTRMDELEINQSELSRLSGVTQPEISYIVRGQRVPWADTAVKLAHALNTTMNELVNFEF